MGKDKKVILEKKHSICAVMRHLLLRLLQLLLPPPLLLLPLHVLAILSTL